MHGGYFMKACFSVSLLYSSYSRVLTRNSVKRTEAYGNLKTHHQYKKGI